MVAPAIPEISSGEPLSDHLETRRNSENQRRNRNQRQSQPITPIASPHPHLSSMSEPALSNRARKKQARESQTEVSRSESVTSDAAKRDEPTTLAQAGWRGLVHSLRRDG